MNECKPLGGGSSIYDQPRVDYKANMAMGDMPDFRRDASAVEAGAYTRPLFSSTWALRMG